MFNRTIKENQVDMIGHLNNAVYLQIFEEARWDLIHSRGYGLKEILASKQGPILLELNLKFLKEVMARDVVTITTELVSYEGKVGLLRQKMIKEDGAMAAQLDVKVGLFDMMKRKLIEPTDQWKKAIGVLA